MVLETSPGTLHLQEVPPPRPDAGQILFKVLACGVCRTDLHLIDGEIPAPKLPVIPGHQIVGEVLECGQSVKGFSPGDRVGIPWLGHTCGHCSYCKSGRENLCDEIAFTGVHLPGGYCEYSVADADYCFALPVQESPEALAPLLCAGLIGYRSYRMTGPAHRIGFYGFGAAAHILTQVAVPQGREIYAFTRPGDLATQKFATQCGAVWAGDSNHSSPQALDAAIIFAPVGDLVPQALRTVVKGGRVVCAGIHMSPIPSFPYDILWEERSIQSVANLTREDGRNFFQVLREIPIRTQHRVYPLEAANEALADLKAGRFQGSAVLKPV